MSNGLYGFTGNTNNIPVANTPGLYIGSGNVSILNFNSAQTLNSLLANSASVGFYLTNSNTQVTGTVLASGVTAGAYGNSTYYPTFTVGSDGRLTVANVIALSSVVSSYGNANVAAFLPTYTGNLTANNITASNNITGNNVSLTGGITVLDNYQLGSAFFGPTNFYQPSLWYQVFGGTTTTAVTNGNIFIDGFTSGLLKSNVKITNRGITVIANVSSPPANISITNGYFVGNGYYLTGITTGSNYGNANVAAYLASGTDTTVNAINANITAANAAIAATNANLGAFETYANATFGTSSYNNASAAAYFSSGTVNTNIITSANVSGNYILGNGSQLTGIGNSYGNANVAAYLPTYAGNIGNVTFSGTTTYANVTTLPAYKQGLVWYDGIADALAYYNNVTNNQIHIGQELQLQVYNNTGSTIPVNSAVYISGAIGNQAIVALAQANNLATSVVVGLANQDIPNAALGYVVTIGSIPYNTTGFSGGDILYLSATTPGALTNVQPTSPNYAQRVATVIGGGSSTGRINISKSSAFTLANSVVGSFGNITVVGNVTAGSLSGNGYSITGLTLANSLQDVALNSTTTGQYLAYNGANWVNTTLSIPTSAGTGLSYFSVPPVVTAGNATNNTFGISTLSSQANTTVSSNATVTQAAAGTSAVYAWVNSPLNRTIVDSGTWSFTIWANTSSTAGGRTAYITKGVYGSTPLTGTVTTAGSGTTRYATASAGNPFTAGNIGTITGNITTTGGWIQTPKGLYPVTAINSNSNVSITTPTTYTNETAVSSNIWKQLFNVTNPTVLATGALASYTFSTTQASYTISTTTSLAEIDFVTTAGGGSQAIYDGWGGTYASAGTATPLAVYHNQLGGIQGGQTDQYYHLTNTEYTGTGSGTFVRATAPTVAGLTDTATTTTANLITTSGVYWANNVSYASTVTGTYSNANVLGYLGSNTAITITTTATVTAANLITTNGVYWSNGAAYSSGAGTYGNTQVGQYLTSGATAIKANLGNVISTGGFFWANGVAYSSGGAGTYGNTQVAAYLPTYTGQLGSASNIVAGYSAIGGTGATIGSGSITIGGQASFYGSGSNAVAIGYFAGGGQTGPIAAGANSVSVGYNAGSGSIAGGSVAIGYNSGASAGAGAVAVGQFAGANGQGAYSVAIGPFAGQSSVTAANSIVINANISALAAPNSGLYIYPVRNDSGSVAQVLYYNTTTKEITYSAPVGSYGNANVASYLAANLSIPINTTSSIQAASYSALGTFFPGGNTQGVYNLGALSYSDTGLLATLQGNTNSYAQMVLQNTNSGSLASTDFIVSNDQGTATTNYGDFGINSSTFGGAGSLNAPGTVFVYAGSTDLAIGTVGSNPIHFVVGNAATDSMTIAANSTVLTGNIINSGRTTTGNLTTTSGVYWANGVSYASTITGSYGNTQVGQYLTSGATAITANLGNVITNSGVFYANGIAYSTPFNGNLNGMMLYDSVNYRTFANAFPLSTPDATIYGNDFSNYAVNTPVYTAGVLQQPPLIAATTGGANIVSLSGQTITAYESANIALQSGYGASGQNRNTIGSFFSTIVTPVTANVMSNNDRVRAVSASLQLNLNGIQYGNITGTASQGVTTVGGLNAFINVVGSGSTSTAVGGVYGSFISPSTGGNANVTYATSVMGFLTFQANTGNTGKANVTYARGFAPFISGQSANLTVQNAVAVHTYSGWAGTGNVATTGNPTTGKYAILNDDQQTEIKTQGNIKIVNNASYTGFMQLGTFTVVQLTAVTGQTGMMASVVNGTGKNAGQIAYWDNTNTRWSWMDTNAAVT